MKTKYFLMATVALFAISCGNKEKKDAAVVEELPSVKLVTVENKMVPQTDSYTATVESDVKNNVSPNMAMRIEKILVDEGDKVSKGQVVVILDQSNLEQVRLQLNNQQIEFERIEQLYKIGGVSKSQYDAAATQLSVLKTQMKQLQTNAALRAPISGVVTARNYDNGDMYAGTPILTIEQTSVVKVKLNVSELHYKDVKKGQMVDIALDAYEGESFEGRVTTIFPSVDAATHTFPVEVTINNASQKVRPGMFARATLNYGEQSHVVVPDETLVKQIGAGDRYVYVYNPKTQTVSYNKVELGQHVGNDYEIISGVNPGDQVVIAGQTRLSNGKKVKVVK